MIDIDFGELTDVADEVIRLAEYIRKKADISEYYESMDIATKIYQSKKLESIEYILNLIEERLGDYNASHP
jgi:hypothetical protein